MASELTAKVDIKMSTQEMAEQVGDLTVIAREDGSFYLTARVTGKASTSIYLGPIAAERVARALSETETPTAHRISAEPDAPWQERLITAIDNLTETVKAVQTP